MLTYLWTFGKDLTLLLRKELGGSPSIRGMDDLPIEIEDSVKFR